jgi:hypothetical protein
MIYPFYRINQPYPLENLAKYAIMKIIDIVMELSRPGTRTEADGILVDHGWAVLGTGVFASVYGRSDRPYVLKLFGRDDLGYLNYLKLITSERSIHFPVVRGKPMRVNSRYWAVQLERLYPTTGSNRELGDLAGAYVRNYITLHGEEREDRGNARILPDKLRLNYGYVTKMRQLLVQFEHHYGELARALRLLVERVFIPGDTGPDMHRNNFMQRGSVLVITDPAADSQEGAPAGYGSVPQSPQLELPHLPHMGSHSDGAHRVAQPGGLPPGLYHDEDARRLNQPAIPGSTIGGYNE